ncbi:entericidin A/B family lipoprotein [Roseobacter denitrificans]
MNSLKGKEMFRIIALVFALTALAACETTKGVGQDIQNAGEELDQAI